MDSFANRLLIFLLTILAVLLTSSPADVPSGGRIARLEASEGRRPSTDRRHRRRLRKTPEDAIRRQIERAKEKILSQLSYSVKTDTARGRVRTPLPQPLHHDLYDIGMTGLRDDLTIIGAPSQRHAMTAHDAEVESNYHQARLIVFDHKKRGTRHGWSYRFRVQGVGAGTEVTSAYLWLHKNRDVSASSGGRLTLNVRSVRDGDVDGVDGDPSRRRSRRYRLSWVAGWEKINVTALLRRPATRLTVRCVGSSAARCRRVIETRSARRRPFVVVATATARPPERRSRRHLRRCIDGDCCALHPYFVKFKDLGWKFVKQPIGFSVNFCYGSCRVSMLRSQVDDHYNGTLYRSVLNIASQVYDDRRLGGCCAPSSTRSISVIYVNEQDQIIQEDIPGVVVSACECV